MARTKPDVRPVNTHFYSGPCAKHPGWSLEALSDAPLGRSHRAKAGQREPQARHRSYPRGAGSAGGLPHRHRACLRYGRRRIGALVAARRAPGDDPRLGVFGAGWVTDVVKQLKLKDVTVIKAPYGELPDLGKVDFANDVVFTWNGTTSGVRVPNGGWISSKRQGLTICDATSAAFAQQLDWPKLDVVTFSWQKALGGEGAHGMLILSPRAVEQLETYKPAWPLPKIFRLTKGGKLNEGVFQAKRSTRHRCFAWRTTSTLAMGEWLGGLSATVVRSERTRRRCPIGLMPRRG